MRYDRHLVSKHNRFALDSDAIARGTPVAVNPGVVLAGVTERWTRLVLDVVGNRTEADSPVIVWTRKGEAWGANQRWALVPLTTQECYPPRPTFTGNNRPITHTAVNDAAFLRGSGDSNFTFVSQHTWHLDTYTMETVLQYGPELRRVPIEAHSPSAWFTSRPCATHTRSSGNSRRVRTSPSAMYGAVPRRSPSS